MAPAEVTVGDPFRSVIRIDAPPGLAVEFPEEPPPSAAIQPLGPVSLRPRNGSDPHIAVYPLVAWQTGTLPAPVVPVHLRANDGAEHVLRVTLPLPAVRSVLPAVPTAEVEPRGARPVLEPERRFPYVLVLLAVLLLAILAALIPRLRRRRLTTPLGVPPRAPRERALAELDEARALGLQGARERREFLSRVSAVVRGYLASVSDAWGVELTTRELLDAAGAVGMPGDHRELLARVLHRADLVKFARRRVSVGEAEQAWGDARRLVEELEAPRTNAEAAAAAAAAAVEVTG